MSKIIQFNKYSSALIESMDVKAFRVDIIRPALEVTGLWSPSSENLLLGTSLVESGLQLVKQLGNGPALSFFQIEPKTYSDVIRYLKRADRKDLSDRIKSACFLDIYPEASSLAWNMRLAVLIARIRYKWVPEPLPEPDNILGMAEYWKRYYNTEKGAGTIDKYLTAWNRRNERA